MKGIPRRQVTTLYGSPQSSHIVVEGISHVDEDEGDPPIPQEAGSFHPSEAASNYDDADRVIHGELRPHPESRSST